MTIPFSSSEDWDDRAHRLYEAGAYDEALEVLQQGLRAFPDSAVLYTGLGYVRAAREEWIWAKNAFEQAVRCAPEDADAWVGLGETLLKFGEVERALDCFASIPEPLPGEDVDLYLAVGRALYTEGLLDEARALLGRLAELHPESAEIAAALGYVLHGCDEEAAARRSLRRALWLDPDLHEARIYLAHLLYEDGSLLAALRELERVPPAEHWDALGVWRIIQLRRALHGYAEGDPRLAVWHVRLAELEAETEPVDHLLAEVEAAFEATRDG